MKRGFRTSIVFILTTLFIYSCQKPSVEDYINTDELPLSTTLDLSSSQNSASLAENIAFTAKISPQKLINGQYPSGTVSFTKNDVTLCDSVPVAQPLLQAKCTIQFLELGDNQIVATYSGDKYYKKSKSNVINTTIKNLIATAVTLQTPLKTDLLIKENLVLSAKMDGNIQAIPMSGVIKFYDGLNTICETDVSNIVDITNITCLYTATVSGTRTLFVQYTGDTNYLQSTSANVTLDVHKIKTTIDLSASNTSPVIGQSLTLTAKLTSDITPTAIEGVLTFKDGDDLIQSCTQSPNNSESTCTIIVSTVGEHKYSVSYNGDNNYLNTTSLQKSITAHPITASMQLKTQETEWIRSQSLTLIATTSTQLFNPTGTLIFKDNGVPIQNCNQIKWNVLDKNYIGKCVIPALLTAGEHIFSVSYQNDVNNLINADNNVQQIVLIPTRVIISSNENHHLPSNQITISAKISIADDIKSNDISGYGDLFVDQVKVEQCSHIEIINGVFPDCSLTYNEPNTHTFRVKYLDKNLPPKYTAAEAEKSISIDTQVPNSPIFIVTELGKISISHNGGRSWINTQTQPTTDTDKALSLFVTPVGDIYVGTTQGHVYRSMDMGNTWHELPPLNAGQVAINSIFITPKYELLVAFNQNGNGVLKSLRLKRHSAPLEWQTEWQTLSPGAFIGRPINAIFAFSTQEAVQNTKIIVAHNNGKLTCRNSENDTWITNNPNTQENITSLYVSMDTVGRKLFFGTDNGSIYKDNVDLDTKEFGPLGYCPNTNIVTQINQSSHLNGTVKGLFITPAQSILYDSQEAQKPLQNFATIYAIINNQIIISRDSGENWDQRTIVNSAVGTSLFVSPILYAVSGETLSTETDIRISKDNGKNWYSIKDGFTFIEGNPSFDSFFVTPQNGFLFTMQYTTNNGLAYNKLLASKDGGLTWFEYAPEWDDPRPTTDTSKATALWVEFLQGSLAYENLRVFAGYTDGIINAVDPSILKYIQRSFPYYDYETQQNRTNLRITSIQPSLLNPSPQTKFADISAFYTGDMLQFQWGDYSAITLLHTADHGYYNVYDTYGSNPHLDPNPFQNSIQALSVNKFTKLRYASVSFVTGENAILYSFNDNNRLWSTVPNSVDINFNRIPIALYTLNDNILFASFIKTRNIDEPKEGQIFITTDKGNTWEPFTTQPYFGNQAASTFFAQYQYN